MLYLIDGYNLLFHLIDSKKSLQSQRQTVIRSLQKEFSLLNLKGMIVFDGSHGHGEESGLSYESPLVIAYSHRGQTADGFILEKLEIAKKPAEITVVTDDRSLSSQARGYGTRTLSLKAFLSFIEKKHLQKKQRQEDVLSSRPIVESKKNLERLKKIFEERLEKGGEEE